MTWEKYADSEKLAALEAERFNEEFEFNHKRYRVFEEENRETER